MAILSWSPAPRSEQIGIWSSDMKATEKLRNAGQSLWLDNITRDPLGDRHGLNGDAVVSWRMSIRVA
jgi:hypothetical protein